MSASRSRRRLAQAATSVASALVLVVAVGVVASPASAGAPRSSATDPTARVIVQAGSTLLARQAVDTVGGQVTRNLPIVHGVAATVPSSSIGLLATAPGIVAVTPDARMTVQGSIVDDRSVEPQKQPKSVYPAVVRATKLAEKGGTGEGIRIAVLDTGINETEDLEGRIVPVVRHFLALPKACVNLSGEPTCADDYGHGTFLAGLMAGDGSASKNRKYAGVAPDAELISIKVGASDGSADVSNVLAGIQWAVSHRQRYDIRVLNLSLGTNSTQTWRSDPLNYAVEKAWLAGIVVVVAASNRGPDASTISKPGDDPYVITVGATDDVMTVGLDDDLLPDFSARGPARDDVAKPDVVAPGAHLVSLRAIGSAIDEEFTNYVDDTYRQGSGTSMSAAVVSGVAAAILSKKPTTEPDRLKFMLMKTARAVAVDDEDAVGQGMVDAYAALTAPAGLANQGLKESTGLGSLDLSRGDLKVRVGDTVVSGLYTAQLLPWFVSELLGDWGELTWFLSHLLNPWRLTQWHDQYWQGHNWEGCSWDDEHSDECFYGHNWEGSTWYGAWD